MANLWAPETNPAGATPWNDEQIRKTPVFTSLQNIPGAELLSESDIITQARSLCVALFEKRAAFLLQSDIESIAKKLHDAGIDVTEKGVIIYTMGTDKNKFKVRGLTKKAAEGERKKFKREYYAALVGQEFTISKRDERTPENRRGDYRLRILSPHAGSDVSFRLEVHNPNGKVISFPPRDSKNLLPGEVLKLNDVMPASQLEAQGTPVMHFHTLWDAYAKVSGEKKETAAAPEKGATVAVAAPAGAEKSKTLRSMLE